MCSQFASGKRGHGMMNIRHHELWSSSCLCWFFFSSIGNKVGGRASKQADLLCLRSLSLSLFVSWKNQSFRKSNHMGLVSFYVSLPPYSTYFRFSVYCIFQLSLEHVKEKLILRVRGTTFILGPRLSTKAFVTKLCSEFRAWLELKHLIGTIQWFRSFFLSVFPSLQQGKCERTQS